jgi:toxin-antitoxin system PIN domain toxin
LKRALLDVNVLIALLDAAHAFHERAHNWWAAHREFGWASCPLTENGTIRIMSHPGYSRRRPFTPHQVAQALESFARASNHQFWPDDISLRNPALFITKRLHSSQQLTDLYLLGLAASKAGRLVTFDQRIPLSAVIMAKPANLCVI